MGVLAIWRYPIKAMVGELLDAVEIGPRGCAGDRRWNVVDADTGERIANKRGPTDPRLRACRAELLDGSDHMPPLRITLPDGSALEGGEIEAALSELLEHRVRLDRCESPANGRFGMTGAYHDLTSIHLITTGTLAHLRTAAPARARPPSAGREAIRGLSVRLLGERHHLGGFDAEHGGGVLAGSEHAIADVEVPDAAVLRLIGVGEALQRVVVEDADCDAFDDDVEALSPGVVAGGQRDPLVALEVARLLLT
jgi:hypothetical protein